jgi:hypothetical protein
MRQWVENWTCVCCVCFLLGFSPSPVAQPHSSAGLNVDFESVFGNKSTNVAVDSGGKRRVFVVFI